MDQHTFTSKYDIDMGLTLALNDKHIHEPVNYFINIDYFNCPYEIINMDSSDKQLLEIAKFILDKEKNHSFPINEIFSDLKNLRKNLKGIKIKTLETQSVSLF